MTKSSKPKSPPSLSLSLHITPEQHDVAVQSNSGGCLIADAIKREYPHLSSISVDMATIRVTDRAKGYRYTYLTPAGAQHLLLSFDQGWRNPGVEEVSLRRAVKIDVVRTSPANKRRAEQNAARKAELEQKQRDGVELSADEKRSLTLASKPRTAPTRPTTPGPVTDVIIPKSGPPTVVGGRPLPRGKDHPNLLRGRNRHFGAKLADPGQAFTEAVEQAVAQKLAELPNTAA